MTNSKYYSYTIIAIRVSRRGILTNSVVFSCYLHRKVHHDHNLNDHNHNRNYTVIPHYARTEWVSHYH